jgi:hypothetical protein
VQRSFELAGAKTHPATGLAKISAVCAPLVP